MKAHPPIGSHTRIDLPAWLLTLIALALIAGVVGVLIGVESQPGAERVIGRPEAFDESRPITSVAEIADEPAKANLLAREVVLDRVPVVQIFGELSFLVGRDEQTVPVVLLGEATGRQPDLEIEVREGQEVRVYGILRELRRIRDIEYLVYVSPEDAERLRDHEVYISAYRVIVLEPAGGS